MDYKLTDTQLTMAQLIWNNEPMPSKDLIRMCQEQFNWKKSTTYTMLKRMEARGLFTNTEGVIKSLISMDEYYSRYSTSYVDNNFGGSLPKFVAAFTRGKKLSKKDISELQKLIDEHEED